MDIKEAIITVLSEQSPGYLASPFMSAFVAAGLNDPEQVERELIALEAEGKVRFTRVVETVVTQNGDGDEEEAEILHEQGWEIG